MLFVQIQCINFEYIYATLSTLIFHFFLHSELEKQRTSSSLPLAQEKDILRQISQIKKAKVQYEENQVHEKAIQEKKVCMLVSPLFVCSIICCLSVFFLFKNRIYVDIRILTN